MNILDKSASTPNVTTADRGLPPLSMEPLIADVRVAMADAEALLKATAEHGGEALEGIRARARESLRAANLQIVNAQHQLALQAKDAAKAADRYVHEHPWTAIGLATGLGVLAAVLLWRR